MHLHTFVLSSIAFIGLNLAATPAAYADDAKPPVSIDSSVTMAENPLTGQPVVMAPEHVPVPPRFKPIYKHPNGSEQEAGINSRPGAV